MSNTSSRRQSRKPGRPKRRAPAPVDANITVERLGAQGDGIGAHNGAPVYVPGLLPGEEARVRLGDKKGEGRIAEVLEVLQPAPERITPPCAYADQCGGCSVQHMADDAYLAWKEGLVDQALGSRSLEPETRLPLLRIGEGRRRLRFAAIGRAGGAILGFNARASRQIVPIDQCIAAVPDLADLPVALRPLLDRLLRSGEVGDVEAWASPTGLDLLLIRNRPLDLTERQAIADFADAKNIARFAWVAEDGDITESVAARRTPMITLGPVRAAPAPGAFLQPTAEGEQAMADFAADHLQGAKHIADLYSGWGPFALRLGGDGVHVVAYEGASAMIAALNQAAGQAGLGGFVKGHVRDLARRPLRVDELKPYDAVLLDPPRSGAAHQVESLATGGPDRIIYLSCNPAALARDGRVLVDAGYRFRIAQPIDQFRWTPHLEVATLFERGGA